LEEARGNGEIGSSLAANVSISAFGKDFELLNSLEDDLRFVMITSEVFLEHVDDTDDAGISVISSKQKKCERCWHYRQDVGDHADYSTLCGRCVTNLFGSGEVRRYA
jgi:isoleucyl-tRNA synthetase